jgi:flagellar basal-body rod protein FlgC
MNVFNKSNLQKILDVAVSGMKAQAERLLVIAQNLANAGSKASAPGVDPYRRKTISFSSSLDRKKGVEVVKVKKVGRDQTPFPMIYSPGAPGADKHGFVAETNVKEPVEMMDMLEAKRGYSANLKAYEKTIQMQQEALSIIRKGGSS